MLKLIARGCPRGPYPGWCDPPGPAAPCATSVPVTFGPDTKLRACYAWTSAPSWWTPLRIAEVAVIAVCAAVLLGLAVAAVRDRLRYRRFLRGES
jgi:hypothetical protein